MRCVPIPGDSEPCLWRFSHHQRFALSFSSASASSFRPMLRRYLAESKQHTPGGSSFGGGLGGFKILGFGASATAPHVIDFQFHPGGQFRQRLHGRGTCAETEHLEPVLPVWCPSGAMWPASWTRMPASEPPPYAVLATRHTLISCRPSVQWSKISAVMVMVPFIANRMCSLRKG